MRLGAREKRLRSVYIEENFFQGGLWNGVVEDHGGHLLVTLQYLEEGNNLRVPGNQQNSRFKFPCVPYTRTVTEMIVLQIN